MDTRIYKGGIVAGTESRMPSRSEMEAMADKRFKNPKPRIHGNQWTIRVEQLEFINGEWQKKYQRIQLGPSTMSFVAAKKEAAERLRPLNQGLQPFGSAVGFKHYLDTVYIPTDLPLMAASTRDRYEGVLRNYLVPAFGDSLLRELTPLRIQTYLSGLAASKLSHESKDKIRDVLASVLGSAVKYGLLTTNPAANLRLPPARHGKKIKPHITEQQFAALIELLQEPYASMVFVSTLTGLRISELAGLKWNDVHADAITIDEKYCRGEWAEPKSAASNTTIAVLPEVIQRISRLKGLSVRIGGGRGGHQTYKVVKSDAADALVFQSVRKGAPMRDNNILSRHIKPAARKLGIPWVNWRCLRTSFATLLKEKGVHVRDAQALMRHSRATTTIEIYQQTTDAHQRAAVQKLAGIAGSQMVN